MEEEGTKTIVLPVGATISFERKNDLVKLSKRSFKSVDKAFAFLETVVEDKDADYKQRVDCAKFIVTMTKELSESISKDQLSRAIAQSRLMLAERATQQRVLKDAGAGSADDEEEYATPKYCPDMILDHSGIKEM